MNVDTPQSGTTTYHRDGDVTMWNTLTQTWHRFTLVPDAVLATLSEAERERVMRHTSL